MLTVPAEIIHDALILLIL